MASEFKACGKEQPAGAETYVCGTPNSREPNRPWHCKKCLKKYVVHLEEQNADLIERLKELGGE